MEYKLITIKNFSKAKNKVLCTEKIFSVKYKKKNIFKYFFGGTYGKSRLAGYTLVIDYNLKKFDDYARVVQKFV